MSLYDYKCFSCSKDFESIESPGTNLSYCPYCGKIGLRSKNIGQGVSFRLKGRCWSKYDYEGKSNKVVEND